MSKIFQNTVCLSVTFHKAGDHRKGDKEAIETDANKRELSLTKKIFRSRAYRDMWKLNFKTKEWIARRAVPSPLRHGTFLIPQQLVDEVVEKVKEAEEKFNELADQFVKEYPALIEEARNSLQSQFNEANYPSAKVIRSKFWVSRMFVKFDAVKGVEQNKEIQDAMDDIRFALREGLLELVSKLQGMLSEKKDGRKCGVRSSTLDAFNEWVELLPKRNILDDDELKGLAEKARSIMKGKTKMELRDNMGLRKEMSSKMDEIGTQLKTLLEVCPRRAFNFEE